MSWLDHKTSICRYVLQKMEHEILGLICDPYLSEKMQEEEENKQGLRHYPHEISEIIFRLSWDE